LNTIKAIQAPPVPEIRSSWDSGFYTFDAASSALGRFILILALPELIVYGPSDQLQLSLQEN
jgi:hypothetical protein